MGYYVDYQIENAIIKKENWAPALGILNEVSRKSYYGSPEPQPTFTSLSEAINSWGFMTEENESFLAITYYDQDKVDDEEDLFKALAPFFEKGAAIYGVGEDDAHWRYVFPDGVLVEEIGTITYS